MAPDLDTLRLVPWQPGTAMCLADVRWGDGRDVAPSPRQVLRRQVARLAERGLSAVGATELEFLVFRDSYEEAWEKGFTGLRPANAYNVDYSVLGTARVEPLIRRIRREGDRRPGGHGDHVHGQVRRARGLLVPRPPLAAPRRRLGALRGRPRGLRAIPGRPARLPARAHAAPRPQRQLLQAVRRRVVRPHRGGVGARQPDLPG